MKTLSIMCALVLVLGMVICSAFAAEFCIDYLETNNPGGWGNSLKTWDKNVPLDVSGTISIDIWANDLTHYNPEVLISGAAKLTWDTSQIDQVVITLFTVDNGGPWDPIFGKINEISQTSAAVAGPSATVKVGSLGGLSPDADDDLILCRIEFHCLAAGVSSLTIEVIPGFPGWQANPGLPTCDISVQDDCYVYDDEMGIKDIGVCRGKTTPTTTPPPVTTTSIPECESDEDCDDELFCNGEESCVKERCRSGDNPCPDDDLFCNGDEICNENNELCRHSGNPCQEGTVCSEEDDECIVQPPPDTTTTTTAIISTSSSIASTSSSTTTIPGLCLIEQIYGEYSKETKFLRYFRDNVLSQSPEGQGIIGLYYQWSPAIIEAMEADEAFKEDVKEMVDGVLELVVSKNK